MIIETATITVTDVTIEQLEAIKKILNPTDTVVAASTVSAASMPEWMRLAINNERFASIKSLRDTYGRKLSVVDETGRVISILSIPLLEAKNIVDGFIQSLNK